MGKWARGIRAFLSAAPWKPRGHFILGLELSAGIKNTYEHKVRIKRFSVALVALLREAKLEGATDALEAAAALSGGPVLFSAACQYLNPTATTGSLHTLTCGAFHLCSEEQ